MRVFPPLPSSPHSRKGLHGHRRRPGVNLPLCCHGNGRAEKKGGSQAVGSYDPTERVGREERSGVCLFMCNCLCLRLLRCCCLSSRLRHLWHIQRNTAWRQCYLLRLIWQSAVSSTSHKEIFLPDTAGFLQDGGSIVEHGLLADLEPLHS